MSEVLIFGLKVAVVGISVVFSALVIIALLVAAFNWLDRQWHERELREHQRKLAKEPTIDDLTLVLITAAAATMVAGRFHIKSVRRVIHGGPLSSTWTLQGRSILHGSHRPRS
ncbi:OadG family protein [bacterium]|nr:OadG family protein [bacterium]